MRIPRSLSLIDFVRLNNKSKGVARNETQRQDVLAKVTQVNNTARENFITEPNDTLNARNALNSEIQLSVPEELHDIGLSYNGTRARDLIGLIAEQVKEHGTPEDKQTLQDVTSRLVNSAGNEKDEKKIAEKLDVLLSKFAKDAGNAFVDKFMNTYCYPAWQKYHDDQGIDVKGKKAFNEQLQACLPVVHQRLEYMSETGKPWIRQGQHMTFLLDECAAISKALIRHDFDAPSPPADAKPEKPATTPETLRATPDGQRYDIHGGAEKGGVTLHINNSNRNGDVINSPQYSGEKPAAADPRVSWLDAILKSNLSDDQKYDLAKRLIDGHNGYRVIDHIDSVRAHTPETVIEHPHVIPAFVQPNNAQPAVDPQTDVVDYPHASDVFTHELETPATETQTRTRSLDEQASPEAERTVAPQTPEAERAAALQTPEAERTAALQTPDTERTAAPQTSEAERTAAPQMPSANPADENNTTRPFTTGRTVDNLSPRNPVMVNHFVPMNQPKEELPTLKPVNGQRTAETQTHGQSHSLDEQTSSLTGRTTATQTSSAYTSRRTVDNLSPRNPVAVNHFVPMNQPKEAFPTLNPVNGLRTAETQTHGQNQSLDEQPSPVTGRTAATQTPSAYTSRRTVDNLSPRNPVAVNHFVPMNQPKEAVPTLNPVNGQRTADSQTHGQTTIEPSMDDIMISTDDALIPGETILHAINVTSSHMSKLRTQGGNEQIVPSASSAIDETADPVPNATQRLGSENAVPASGMDGQQEIKQKADALRLQREASESQSAQPDAVQQSAAQGTSGNAVSQDTAANSLSIAERIRAFQDAPKSGVEKRSGSVNAAPASGLKAPDWQQEVKQKADELRLQREARESLSGQPSTVQGTSGNAVSHEAAEKPLSIAERLRYFQDAQKAGAGTAAVGRTQSTSSTAPGQVYSTIRTRSQWSFDVPEPKSFVPRDVDTSVSGAVHRGEATNISMTNRNRAGANGDE